MKLYATITSERASKGQGGNEYIRVELRQAKNTPVEYYIDYDSKGILVMGSTYNTLLEKGEPKGEQQKGEECGNCGRPATQSIGESMNRCDRCTNL